MQALILTNEYPPNVYGGAGVHVEYLTRELAQLIDVDVRTFGEQDVREGSLRVRGRAGHGRRRPLPHVVRTPRWDPREARLRHPARDHRPLAGAAQPVETR